MPTSAIDALIHRDLPAAANGCEHAYGRIIVASQNTVTAVALAITRDVTASEDIAQEAFLSAWQNLKRLQNAASFLPWLRQITRNLAYDHLRSLRHRNVHGEAAELAIAHAADPSALPDERLLDAEREQLAADLISELPEESREVLLLYYREGQNSRQVASLLGLSDAAVRKRLSRARRSVRGDLIGRFSEFARGSARARIRVGWWRSGGAPGGEAGFAKAAPAVVGGCSARACSARPGQSAVAAGQLITAGCAGHAARLCGKRRERAEVIALPQLLWTSLAAVASPGRGLRVRKQVPLRRSRWRRSLC